MKFPPRATLQQVEAFHERAGIKEFEAGLSREQAEREAYREIFGIELVAEQEKMKF